MTPDFLIDGEVRPGLPVTDRGFTYGDGVFETIRITDGLAELWHAHLARLEKSCRALGFTPPPAEALVQDARRLFRDGTSGVLKIIVTRGSGGRGYAPPQTPAPRRIVICGLLPEEAPAPVTLTLCATRLSAQPALAGIKTLGRQDQLLARREWTDATVFDGLMRDAHDRVVETTFANIFIRRGGAIETPPIEATGIDGVMRHCLIELLAQDCPVRERPMTLADITAADGLCLTNSIRRLCPVGRLVGLDGGEVLARFDPHAFDDIARRLRQRVRDLTGY